MVLGADGDQLVPGHPHFWQESNGATYLGYDFRPGCIQEDTAACGDVTALPALVPVPPCNHVDVPSRCSIPVIDC